MVKWQGRPTRRQRTMVVQLKKIRNAAPDSGAKKPAFRMTRSMWIGLGIVLVGVVVMCVPMLRNASDARMVADLADQILAGDVQDLVVPMQVTAASEVDAWDFQTELAARHTGPTPVPTAMPTQIKLTPLGVVNIPKIDSKQPLIEGAGKTELHYGVGHLKGTAAVGTVGNCVVAGHRNYTYGQVWNRLNEVAEGDEVIITRTDGKVFTYRVFEIKIYEPGDAEILSWYQDTKQLTLITCDPVRVADKRLIIRCNLEPET